MQSVTCGVGRVLVPSEVDFGLISVLHSSLECYVQQIKPWGNPMDCDLCVCMYVCEIVMKCAQ